MPKMKSGECEKWLQVSSDKEKANVVRVGIGADGKCKIREAERAEKLLHLICWGPNK